MYKIGLVASKLIFLHTVFHGNTKTIFLLSHKQAELL